MGLNLGSQRVKNFAQYIQETDPYDHPITVHQAGNPDNTWTPFVNDSRFQLTSFQYAGSVAGRGNEIEEWRDRTANAGWPIPIHMDELRSLDINAQNADEQRKDILWPTYLSGGGGIEWYVASGDQSIEDFRGQELMWQYTWYARKFMEENLPYWEMIPQDDILSGGSDNRGQVFAKPGEIYAIYFERTNDTGSLNIPSGSYQLSWYNPRSGNFSGNTTTITGDANTELGAPPNSPSEDWCALLINQNTVSIDPSHSQIPGEFALFQNYPNPFNPTTTIEYMVGIRSNVRMEIYNVRGQLVHTLFSGYQEPGSYRISWDATNDRGGITK